MKQKSTYSSEANKRNGMEVVLHVKSSAKTKVLTKSCTCQVKTGPTDWHVIGHGGVSVVYQLLVPVCSFNLQ